MAKSVASERCRYRARLNTGAFGYMFGSHINLHMRRKSPGWARSPGCWRLPYAERKAVSEYKGYAPLMDGSRMAIPKWLAKKLAPTPAAGAE